MKKLVFLNSLSLYGSIKVSLVIEWTMYPWSQFYKAMSRIIIISKFSSAVFIIVLLNNNNNGWKKGNNKTVMLIIQCNYALGLVIGETWLDM